MVRRPIMRTRTPYTTLYKYPGETRRYAFEFSEQPELETTNLTGTPTIRQQVIIGTGSLTITNIAVSGTKVVCRIAGGALGSIYELVCKVATAEGDTLGAVGRLRIERI